MSRFLRLALPGIAGLAVLCASVGPANAGIIYSQNFDTGTSDTLVLSGYWYDPTGGNGAYTGKITQTAGSAYGGIFGNGIGADASGSGYFLFEGTGGGGTASTPIFQSPTFAVAANTSYTLSFALANEDGVNFADLQPVIDGTTLGSGVSATGIWTTTGWQTFTFTWNSGSNTTASVIINDLQTSTTGNDFGVDSIVLGTTSATPEPATLTLFGIGALGLMGHRWRRERMAAVA